MNDTIWICNSCSYFGTGQQQLDKHLQEHALATLMARDLQEEGQASGLTV
jgi:hypothetical protein